MLKRPKEEAGKFLKASLSLGLYVCGGLNVVGSLTLFQKSSVGVPQSLNIL